MRLRGMLFVLFLLLPALALAQDEEPATRWVQVVVDSAFLRVEPLPDAEPVGSVFEGESLQAIGRNADGMWFEVRRPGSSGSGWINKQTVLFMFNAFDLPLTSTAGVEGGEPVIDTGVAVTALGNVVLRDDPLITAAQIGVVPNDSTVPALARNQDASWIFVNYNGTVGWVAAQNLRGNDLRRLPEGTELPMLQFEIVIIPPEVQLAQVERLRAYIATEYALAENLAFYWKAVLDGEILPCTPPSFSVAYPRTEQDVIELPELRRFLPNLDDATASLNESIDALQRCGAFEPDDVVNARNSAINARLLFNATLNNLDFVEDVIRRS